MFKDFLKSRILPTRPHRLADCLLKAEGLAAFKGQRFLKAEK